MDSKSSFSKKMVLLCLLSLVATACSSSNDDDGEREASIQAEQTRQAMNIELASVSADGCLNLEKYFGTLRTLNSDARARKIATKLQIRNSGMSRNSYLRTAFGNLKFLDTTVPEIPDFVPMTQDKCKTITLANEGHSDTYKVIKAKEDSITYETSWDSIKTVKWTSPTSMEITKTSRAADACTDKGKADVTVTESITWGDDSIFTTTLEEKAIDPNFLSIISEASGFQLNTLYSDLSSPVLSTDPTLNPPEDPVIVIPSPETPTEPPVINPGEDGSTPRVEPVTVSDRRLLVSKVKEMISRGPRPELIQCF
jgi:hypothetical protein